MAKRRQIHCKCGSPITIYKKGKKHRVFICPQCGIIATNPVPLLAPLLAAGGRLLAGGAVKTAAVSGLSALAGTKLGQAFGKATDEDNAQSGNITIDNKDIPNNFKSDTWYIQKALKM